MLPVGVVVSDADGKIIEANELAHEIWGGDVFDAASVEEYEQYPVWWADSGESVPPEQMTLARVVDGEEVTEPDVFEIETLDGVRKIIELEGKPIRDETGAVTRGVVVLSDVTERVRAQHQLAESERRYRTLAEHFPNGAVAVYDHDLRFTLVGGEEVGGRLPAAEEIEGNTPSDLYPDDFVAELEPMLRAAIEHGASGSTQTTFADRHWEVWATPLYDAEDEIFAGLTFAQDVTEQREYERKLEESNERLEQFAYAASHDLQEPLRMVSSYLQLIERRADDELSGETEEYLEFAVDGADRMRAMIDGLLRYSRVETQGEPLEPVDLEDVIDDVRHDLDVQIAETGAEVTVEELPPVIGDEHQLHQVFQNLLRNAIEYSGDDPPTVRVSAARNGVRWTVSVQDDGVGIDPADQDRIFEVFQRLESRGDSDGSGIGLALCERIVERHGGEIWVDAEPGEGSTFSFTLPAVEGADD